MQYNLLIRNGRVIDPLNSIDEIRDVFVKNSKIVPAPTDNNYEVSETVDATGCIVTPGLIDFHTHSAYHTSEQSIKPDIVLPPNGVTAAVDAGTCGTANFESMVYNVIAPSALTIKAYLHLSPLGISTVRFAENLNSAVFDIPKMEYLFERYPEDIIGFKLRIGGTISAGLHCEPIKTAIEFGERFGCPVYVHIIDPEDSVDEAAPYFRAGDVFAHVFQELRHTILDENGKVRSSILEARKRGVIFDSAQGGRGRSLTIARKAIEQGFYPDVISSDAYTFVYYKKVVFSLLRCLSEFLSMGMPLMEVIRACTQTPAKLMGLENTIGTLAPGARADIAILKVLERPVHFDDLMGNTYEGNRLFVPQMTVVAGQTLYRQIEFMF